MVSKTQKLKAGSTCGVPAQEQACLQSLLLHGSTLAGSITAASPLQYSVLISRTLTRGPGAMPHPLTAITVPRNNLSYSTHHQVAVCKQPMHTKLFRGARATFNVPAALLLNTSLQRNVLGNTQAFVWVSLCVRPPSHIHRAYTCRDPTRALPRNSHNQRHRHASHAWAYQSWCPLHP